MMLSEESAAEEGTLPVGAFKDHLRLGTGFADDGVEEPFLEAILRAATATVERRIGKTLLARGFRMSVTQWQRSDSQRLPTAPVSAVTAMRVYGEEGGSEPVSPERYRLVPDPQTPRVVARHGGLPPIPSGGSGEIDFEAGFGREWTNLPDDLAQAVFLLAAHYHENRHAAGEDGGMIPFGVSSLLAPWRPVRLVGGGAV